MQPASLLDIDARGVASLTLNRPEVHHAFDDQLIARLIDQLEEVRLTEARLLVLRSSGKSFSAGADLAWMQRMAQMSQAENLQDAQQLALLMERLDLLPCPTLCLVQGAAYGGAVGLIACCDVALASDQASLCLSEVKLGLAPAVISPYVLRAIGERALRRYALTAEVISATTAAELGLVHQVVAAADLEHKSEQLVQRLLNNGPKALQACKQLLRYVGDHPINATTQARTTACIAQLRVEEEGQAGLSAFFAKRPPPWQPGVCEEPHEETHEEARQKN
ncbi:enoyl-CoA hydratase-related protein [Marinospirillum sp. MEB164]|uniref:Enoyl-CoA hydratase-related protein n=2 Tax=Marinospirillum alkalitolerans TaxID=3123374 RepID=A0ABW8PYA0_9GAMM